MCSKECVERIENLFRECFQSLVLAATLSTQSPLDLERIITNFHSVNQANLPCSSSSIISSNTNTNNPTAVDTPDTPRIPDSIQLKDFLSRLIPTSKVPSRRRRKRKSRCSKTSNLMTKEAGGTQERTKRSRYLT